jgi:hypothetical protein
MWSTKAVGIAARSVPRSFAHERVPVGAIVKTGISITPKKKLKLKIDSNEFVLNLTPFTVESFQNSYRLKTSEGFPNLGPFLFLNVHFFSMTNL